MNKFNEQKPKFVAVKVNGILKDSKLEDNVCVNADLLEADGVENSSINRNKIISSNGSPINNIEIIGRDKIKQHGGDKNKASIENKSEKEGFFNKIFWRFIVLIIAGLLVAYLVFKFGWK